MRKLANADFTFCRESFHLSPQVLGQLTLQQLFEIRNPTGIPMRPSYEVLISCVARDEASLLYCFFFAHDLHIETGMNIEYHREDILGYLIKLQSLLRYIHS